MTEITDQNHALEQLLDYVKRERGFDFTGYRRPSLTRRIDKRILEASCEGYPDYLALLEAEPQEFAELFDMILINVTSFFRDPAAWEYIENEIVPRIVETKPRDEPIRVWSTGCSTGEEAYTVAIVLAEVLGADAFRERVRIYGTDVDENALATARAASFAVEQLHPVPDELRARYFEPADDSRMVVRPELRRAVIFGRHDLIQDPTISRIDLLMARNTLIYFSSRSQDAILEGFHFSVNERGFLMLGSGEAVAARSQLFEPVDLKRRVLAPLPKSADGRSPRLRLVSAADGRESAAPAQLGEQLREPVIDLSPVAPPPELETNEGELRSATEALETTNVELQSTNEELETMNEELQSANEELETLNDELRRRPNDLGRVDQLMESLPVTQLAEVLRRVLEGGDVSERLVDASTDGGNTIRFRVTCSPLRDGTRVRGAILVMEEQLADESG